MTGKQTELDDLRNDIEQLDKTILSKLHERDQLVEAISKVKKSLGLQPKQPGRFEELLQKLKTEARDLDLDDTYIEELWNVIHEHSVNKQNLYQRD